MNAAPARRFETNDRSWKDPIPGSVGDGDIVPLGPITAEPVKGQMAGCDDGRSLVPFVDAQFAEGLSKQREIALDRPGDPAGRMSFFGCDGDEPGIIHALGWRDMGRLQSFHIRPPLPAFRRRPLIEDNLLRSEPDDFPEPALVHLWK